MGKNKALEDAHRTQSFKLLSKATAVQDLVKNFPLIDVYGDAMRDKDLVGHVFHNSFSATCGVYTTVDVYLFTTRKIIKRHSNILQSEQRQSFHSQHLERSTGCHATYVGYIIER
ncbi:unnamed protein product [Pocillopora meandrina]|uniref:Uncharacterized protein n=1 Tax=Pocillopora meandrina TaxID=46732 RepID=A0AAU9WPY8_9CNID|nr:unnamed protein product [Pocillopora meandrina]